jgi:hypothetical protein
MRFLDRSSKHLAEGPSVLFAADPGETLWEAARLYDPTVRRWHGRLVFSNGVLLFGPQAVEPAPSPDPGFPDSMTVGWYVRSALQRHSGRRTHEAKQSDGERLLRGLAVRLGGVTHPGVLQPDLALLASIYSEHELSPEQVIDTLRPFNGDMTLEDDDVRDGSYSLTGPDIFFYTAYWRRPQGGLSTEVPPALGELHQENLHRWDLHTGVAARTAHSELCLKVASAALALAGRARGVAIDMFGFPLARADDLKPG